MTRIEIEELVTMRFPGWRVAKGQKIKKGADKKGVVVRITNGTRGKRLVIRNGRITAAKG